MKPLLSRVEATLQEYKMLAPGESILIACSGGADSVALFHLLREIAPRWRLRLHLLHFDHALRRGSERDFQFVEKLARDYQVPFHGGRRRSSQRIVQKGLSPEEGARKMRYEFFEKLARKIRIRKIALAHQRDDQAETVLMRIIQGTGLRGLQGIRPVVQRNGVTFIRPLIEVSRTEIGSFLEKHSLPHREDLTNRSRRFLRNRIRNVLLPLLEKEFNPQIRESLCRLAETASAESGGLDDWLKRNWRTFLSARRNGTVWLDRERFLLLPAVLQFRLLDQILRVLEPSSGMDFESWQRIEKELLKGHLRMTLPRDIDLRLTPKKLFIRKNDTINRKGGKN